MTWRANLSRLNPMELDTSKLPSRPVLPLLELAAKASQGQWATGCFVNPESKCQCKYIFAEGYCGAIADIRVSSGLPVSEEGGDDDPPIEEARANALLIARCNPHDMTLVYKLIAEALERVDGDTLLYNNLKTALDILNGNYRPTE